MVESKVSRQALLVAAIDFGTTFSGWAYQTKTDYKTTPTKVYCKNWNNDSNISSKTPTTVLIQPDGKTFEAFGYRAEDKYAELAENDEHEVWFYFRRFKMKLFEAESITLDMKIEAENGKKLPAILIFSLVISSLKKDLMEECNKRVVGGIKDSDVLWVLTVPAIWNDGAKQFMREAGITAPLHEPNNDPDSNYTCLQAGILSDRLVIALEPEAASMYCRQASLDKQSGLEGVTMETLSPGTTYLILDAGGGTIDINVHEVLQDGNLREVYKPTGSNWGGTKVDEAFHQFFSDIFGPVVMGQFQKDYMDDYISLFRSLEVKKRGISQENEAMTIFCLPITLIDLLQKHTGNSLADKLASSPFRNTVMFAKGDKLKVSAAVMQSFYKDSVKNIIAQLNAILRDKHVKSCQTILMVGGYSEARLLREEIKRKFPKMNTVIPNESSLVVLKGAVLYGRNPQVIASRVCKYTYGIKVVWKYDPKIHPKKKMFVNEEGEKKVRDVFHMAVEAGQEVLTHQKYDVGSRHPSTKTDTVFSCRLYASTGRHLKYIDEPGCFEVGRFVVNCLDKHGKISNAKQELMFGGTEVEIRTVLETTGEETRDTIRLPD